LKIPLLGDALRKAETARFARAMATLVANSVPLVQCVNISRAILGNRRIANSLDSVTQGIKRGEGISEPLRRTGQFPALAAHLLSVGEETGKLDAMFTRMADIYETETRDSIKRFTATTIRASRPSPTTTACACCTPAIWRPRCITSTGR